MADKWPPPDPVFRPLFRPYADGGDEVRRLYDHVRALHEAEPPSVERFSATVMLALKAEYPSYLHEPVRRAVWDLARLERQMFLMPDFVENRLPADMLEFKEFLNSKLRFFQNRREHEQLLDHTIIRIFTAIAEMLPSLDTPTPFTTPIVCALPKPHAFISQITATMFEVPIQEADLFTQFREQLYINVCLQSGIEPHTETTKRYVPAAESRLAPEDLAAAYLAGTPLLPFFQENVPLRMGHEERFSHMHVLGGTGAGKTSALEMLILHDLHAVVPPALVIIDSQTDLIQRLSHLKLFEEGAPLADRLVLISPRDIKHPPALNIFDLHQERFRAYDEATREQVTAGVVQTFDYVFQGLLGADLTAKQDVFFKYVARLMLSLPDTHGRPATILDMLYLMEDVEQYRSAIDRLPPIPRRWFEKDFTQSVYKQTKEQIRYRLQAIIENPTMARLFTSARTKIDLFSEINRGSIILVDTAKDFLKGASAHFGRIIISLVLQAIQERAAIPEKDRRPAFLIVDEAAEYFDDNIDDLLTEARKYRVGCLFAHQFLEQSSQKLRASLAANTAIKMVGGASAHDASVMAAEMRTDKQFVLEQPRLHFATYIRNITPQAVSVPVAPGILAGRPRMSDAAYERLIERNRHRVWLPPEPTPESAPAVSPLTLGADENIAREW